MKKENKNIGIIVAMEEELEEILKILKKPERRKIYNIEFIEGDIDKNHIIIVKSGIGKVNAARTTQILIDKFNVECVINIGAAGALNPKLNIGDIIIAEKIIQHDFDITAFNHKKGFITGVGDYIYSDKNIVDKLNNIINKMHDKIYKVNIGTIATGDIFCTEIEMKNKINSKFNADCVEMEGAAVAQVCYLDRVPFVIIRSISDSPNGNNAIVFDKFVKLASERCVKIFREFLKFY